MNENESKERQPYYITLRFKANTTDGDRLTDMVNVGHFIAATAQAQDANVELIGMRVEGPQSYQHGRMADLMYTGGNFC